MSQTSVSSSVHTQAYTRPDSWDAVLNSCHRRVLAVLYTHRPTPDQTELRCCTELMSQTSVSSSVHTQAYTRPDRVEMLYWTHRQVFAVLYTHRPTPDQTELRCCTELMSQTSVSSSVHTQAYTRPDSWDAVLNSCHRRELAVLYTHRPTPDQTELRCCTELMSQTSVSSSVTHMPTPDQTQLRCCTELMSQTSVSSSVHTQAYTRPDRVEMLYWTHVTDEC